MRTIGLSSRNVSRSGFSIFSMLALWLIGFAVCDAHAQFMPRPTVIENVSIHTPDGEVVESGTIIIRGSRIGEIGAGIEPPRRAIRIDGSGLHATPGLIDALSGLSMPVGLSGGSNPVASAHDGFDRYDARAITQAIAHGVTCVYVSTSAHRGFGPAGSVMRLQPQGNGAFGEILTPRAAIALSLHSDGDQIERLLIVDSVRSELRNAREHEELLELYDEQLAEYLKKLKELREDGDANNSNHARLNSVETDVALDFDEGDQMQRPSRRPRQQQRGSQGQQEANQDNNEDSPEKPARPTPNPQFDVLIDAMNHEIPVRVYADRSEDILNALEIAREFGLRMIVEGGAEAHLVADRIADAGVYVILTSRAGSDRPRTGRQLRTSPHTIAALDQAGVDWTIASGASGDVESRFLLPAAQHALLQARPNVNPIQLVTTRAAKILGVDDRLGRLSEGMQADIVLWSGDPRDPASRVQRVMIAGRTVFEGTEDDS